jgi:hypothetical protein
MFALLLFGCVSSRPTDQLYGEIQQLRLYGFVCAGGPPPAMDARLGRLAPWLDATLGAGTFAEGEARLGQENGLVDLTRCPTAEERRRATRAYASRLGTLERRAR